MTTLLEGAHATAARQKLADEAMATLLPSLSRALAQVYVQAVVAASASVVLAAGDPAPNPFSDAPEPFTLARVRGTFRALSDRAPAWLADRLIDIGNELADKVHGVTARALTTFTRKGRQGRDELIRELNAQLAPEAWEGLLEGHVESEATLEFNRRQLVAFANAGRAFKKWQARNDDRTRRTHHAADNQRVRLNDRFVVGQDQLLFPGDPSGSPGEVYNCRCLIVPG